MAVALGLVLTRDSPERTGAPAAARALPLPTPHSIVRHGVRYVVALRPPSGVIVDPGSRTVTVYAMDVEQRTDPACSSLRPRVRLVSETAAKVRIATFAYEVPALRDGRRTCAYVRESSQSLLVGRPVRLRAPLAGRALVDARTGKQFAVLDAGYVPTPSYVPNGYRQTLVSHYTPRDEFLALRQFMKGAASLEIQVSSEINWAPTGRLLGHARVQGATARVSDQSYQRCVSWSLRAGVVAEVCSVAEKRSYLAVGELLHVARTVT